MSSSAAKQAVVLEPSTPSITVCTKVTQVNRVKPNKRHSMHGFTLHRVLSSLLAVMLVGGCGGPHDAAASR